jgi:hypothetical protein
MKKLSNLALALVLLMSTTALAFAATAWPSTDYTEIGDSVRALYPAVEPSGLAWDSSLNKLLMVGNEGHLFALNPDGSDAKMVTVSGDLEGVVPVGDYIYVADENGRFLKLQVNFDEGTVSILQTWDTTPWMKEVTCPGGFGACGAEALTYADGYFYAGYQYNGKIYKFDLSGSTPVKVGELAGLSTYGYWDISDLSYRDGYLYALYTSKLAIMDMEGNVQVIYDVPGVDNEGIALGNDSNGDGDANMFLAEDNAGDTGHIYSHDNFPVYGWTAPVEETDPDVDGDGVLASLDCNDSDASVSSVQTYYVDADLDGEGSSSTAAFCSSTAPAGYADDGDDYNDSIPSNGVEHGKNGVDDDGDGTIDEVNLLATNGMHPYYSTLDAGLSSTGYIKKVWGLTRGAFGVSFADGSRYRYYVVSSKTTEVSTVTLIPDTAYVQVTTGEITYTVNAYTGEIL